MIVTFEFKQDGADVVLKAAPESLKMIVEEAGNLAITGAGIVLLRFPNTKALLQAAEPETK